jgi:hypothetical protein
LRARSRYVYGWGEVFVGVGVLAIIAGWSSNALADGIDIPWFFTRVGGWKASPWRAVGILTTLIVVDYGLNVLVIGLPAWRSGVPLCRAALDLLSLTLVAQVADRAGIVAYSLTSYALDRLGLITVRDLGLWVVAILLASFITSGVLLWFLAKFFCSRRWKLPQRQSNLIATAAAVITNPAWAIGAAFIVHF